MKSTITGSSGIPVEIQSIPRDQKTVYLKAKCDFRDHTDKAYFFNSLDLKSRKPIGTLLQMQYKITQFMGCRFGLFNYVN